MPFAESEKHLIAATTDISGNYAWGKNPEGFNPDEWREPYLQWFEKPANFNGACVILISGGGYYCCCDTGLLRMWKEKYTAAGFQCVNFVYRTPRPKAHKLHEVAWADGQRAVRVVRSQAAKRGYDPERIGTMSMSAGSHLATLLAVSSQTPAYAPVDALDTTVPCHIDWAITGAIAYGVSDGFGIPNDRLGIGSEITLDPAFKFDAKSAPMCMFHGGVDAYSPIASTKVYRHLREIKVPAELHLYADRVHGFWAKNRGGEDATAYDNWFEQAEGFLRQLNFDGKLGKEVKLADRFPSDDDRAKYEKYDLWPEGKMPYASTNQCTPYLEWHFPKELKTKAIQIVYSGGGYNNNSPEWGWDGVPATRRFLNAKGMTVVTMRYRTPRPQGLPKHVTAWADLQRAIRDVRAKAPGYGLDPDRIGIMGSSAGGHLTLMGATTSKQPAYRAVDELDRTVSCSPNWAVAVYPAYVLSDGVDGANAKGGNPDDAVINPEFAFDLATCPILFLHGDADVYASMGSVKCWEKLRHIGVQCDLHTLVKRGHCFQVESAPGTGSWTWLNRIWEFMNHKGFNR